MKQKYKEIFTYICLNIFVFALFWFMTTIVLAIIAVILFNYLALSSLISTLRDTKRRESDG